MKLEQVQKALGHRFSNEALLRLALVHPSGGSPNNQRLEYLGDAVLELCISHLLYERYPQADEGKLTRMRANLVREDSLWQVAQGLGIHTLLRTTPPFSEEPRGQQSMTADAMEAVLAAIYLDAGFDATLKVVDSLWIQLFETVRNAPNAKVLLQEHFQAQAKQVPEYRLVGEEGPPHLRVFRVSVSDESGVLAIGEGRSKRQAELSAAGLALKTLSTEGAGHEA